MLYCFWIVRRKWKIKRIQKLHTLQKCPYHQKQFGRSASRDTCSSQQFFLEDYYLLRRKKACITVGGHHGSRSNAHRWLTNMDMLIHGSCSYIFFLFVRGLGFFPCFFSFFFFLSVLRVDSLQFASHLSFSRRLLIADYLQYVDPCLLFNPSAPSPDL